MRFQFCRTGSVSAALRMCECAAHQCFTGGRCVVCRLPSPPCPAGRWSTHEANALRVDDSDAGDGCTRSVGAAWRRPEADDARQFGGAWIDVAWIDVAWIDDPRIDAARQRIEPWFEQPWRFDPR